MFQIPGKLKVYPQEDGDISILADVSVTSTEAVGRSLVRFNLVAETTKDVEFISIPSEIIKGSSEDPRDWEWGDEY